VIFFNGKRNRTPNHMVQPFSYHLYAVSLSRVLIMQVSLYMAKVESTTWLLSPLRPVKQLRNQEAEQIDLQGIRSNVWNLANFFVISYNLWLLTVMFCKTFISWNETKEQAKATNSVSQVLRNNSKTIFKILQFSSSQSKLDRELS